jgi:inosine-uridine nucleoside N-ribohydrolase
VKRVIIDTDPGIDDAAAIFLALGSPELQVDALTTVFGNTAVEQCTVNALRILEAAGRSDIPVYQGSGRPFNFGEPEFAEYIHGSDGLGDAGLPAPSVKVQDENAVIKIVQSVMDSPGQITFVALGRLTNLALAISVEPRIATSLVEVVVMGGAVTVPGNVSMVSSANLWGDPEAADVVYRSGASMVQVGLDVCNKVEISAEQLSRVWAAGTPVSRLLEKATPFIQRAYIERNRKMSAGAVKYNDVPAISYAIDPTLFETRNLHVRIAKGDQLTQGQTLADLDGQTGESPNTHVALDVDANRLSEMWTERVSDL